MHERWGVWDEDDVLDVLIQSPGLEFESRTELEVLNGANLLLVGEEIVQFAEAEQLGSSEWRLSKLLRGRRGTEWAMSMHQVGEPVLVLDPATLTRTSSLGEVGLSRFYRAVSIGSDPSLPEAGSFANEAASLKPYAPVHIRGSRNGGGDLTIGWIRRTRFSGEWRDLVDVLLNEASEAYEVDVLDGAGEVVRTLSNTSPSVAYMAAAQTSDFGAPQSAIEIAVHQLSAAVGRGFAGRATRTPNLGIAHILQSQAQKEVTANAAFDALDQAIAGLLEVDLSAGGTITPDAADALKCKLLRLTGTLAADAEVVVPDNRKPYFLHNATAGGFAVTVRTAAGTGVVVGVSPDDTAVVYCDGTDVLAISAAGEESADLPYDPAMFIPGTHAGGALMAQIVFPRTVTFRADFAGPQAYAQVAATANTTLDVQQNGTSIGSITFGAASSSATFSLAADTAYAPGDRLAIVNQDPADATLADLSITLKGSR